MLSRETACLNFWITQPPGVECSSPDAGLRFAAVSSFVERVKLKSAVRVSFSTRVCREIRICVRCCGIPPLGYPELQIILV